MNLYDEETARYTPEGVNLARRLSVVLKPIFKEYRALGYSIREIAHVAFHEIINQESCIILTENVIKAKARKGSETCKNSNP